MWVGLLPKVSRSESNINGRCPENTVVCIFVTVIIRDDALSWITADSKTKDTDDHHLQKGRLFARTQLTNRLTHLWIQCGRELWSEALSGGEHPSSRRHCVHAL